VGRGDSPKEEVDRCALVSIAMLKPGTLDEGVGKRGLEGDGLV